jgi:hypothetical protein
MNKIQWLFIFFADLIPYKCRYDDNKIAKYFFLKNS